jgi:hypothetical protein
VYQVVLSKIFTILNIAAIVSLIHLVMQLDTNRLLAVFNIIYQIPAKPVQLFVEILKLAHYQICKVVLQYVQVTL